jgi:1-phosphofructokinase/tagatose 6-phosphate kinase
MFLTVSMNPTIQKVLVFSGLSPGAVNRASFSRMDLAGKGLNVCRVLGQLGRKAVHLTQLGGDLKALFLEYAAREGLELHWVESGSSIRFCYTLIEEGNRAVTELIEKAGTAAPGTEERFLEVYRKLLGSADFVIIAGTKAPGFSGRMVPLMTGLASEAGRRVILDVWGGDLLESLAAGPFLIKPNLEEFAATFLPGLSGNSAGGEIRGEVEARCRELCGEYRCSIVLTRGSEPVWFASGDRFNEYPLAAAVVNTTGSGDAFTAGLAAALGDGADLGAAVAAGARCGGLNAGLLQVGSIR